MGARQHQSCRPRRVPHLLHDTRRARHVTSVHHVEVDILPTDTDDEFGGPNPSTKSSKSLTSSLRLRRRTFRVGGLVAVTTAFKAGAFLVAAFYLFGGVLLFCVLTLGVGVVLVDFARKPNRTQRHQYHHLDQPPRHTAQSMWTLAQFETFGALRLDDYLRFLVSKLALVWRSIAAIHKSAVNYSFTVSIAETPSVVDLENLLDGRIPLLTYEGVASEDEWARSRAASLASSICDEDTTSRASTYSIATTTTSDPNISPEEEVYYAIEVNDDDAEDTSDDDDLPPLQCSETCPCNPEVEAEPPVEVDEAEVKLLEAKLKATVTALRTVMIPLMPLAEILDAAPAPPTCTSCSPSLDPLVVPFIKPLIRNVQLCEWKSAAKKPSRTPQAHVQVARPSIKRRISVSVAPSKPHTRLVVKPKPSTLTPPQNVQRMMVQAEQMMREVHELLAAGNAVLYPSTLDSSDKKSVRFSEQVELIESLESLTDDEDSLRDSLFYDAAEIESMSEEFFASAA